MTPSASSGRQSRPPRIPSAAPPRYCSRASHSPSSRPMLSWNTRSRARLRLAFCGAAERLREIQEALDDDQNMLIDWRAPSQPSTASGRRTRSTRCFRSLPVSRTLSTCSRRYASSRRLPGGRRQACGRVHRQATLDARAPLRCRARLHAGYHERGAQYPEARWSETAAGMFAVGAMIELRLLPARPGSATHPQAAPMPATTGGIWNAWCPTRSSSTPSASGGGGGSAA